MYQVQNFKHKVIINENRHVCLLSIKLQLTLLKQTMYK